MENQVVIFDELTIEKQLKTAAIAAKYQDVLNSVAEIEFTRDNVGKDLLAPARNVLEALKAKKDEIKRPHLDANKAAEEAFRQLSQPLEQLINEKVRQKAAIANQIEAERRKIEEERAKIKQVTDYIANFYSEASKFMSDRKVTPDDIVKLERRIGVELSRKSFYGALYDSFVEKTNELRKIIAETKEFLRRNEKLTAKLEKVGDNEEKKAEILEEKEDLSIFLMQNKVEFQEAANIDGSDLGVVIGESVSIPVVAARTQWTYEITDIHELYRKHPELVIIEPNAAAIRAFSSNLRNMEENKGKNEIKIPGIRFYQEKKYK